MNSTFEIFRKYKLELLLLGLWALILIVQSVLTPIHPDEAYYRMYSKELAFGYFDHPPGIAVSIFLSSFFGEGNLSIRFFGIILHLLSIIILSRIIDFKSKKHLVSGFLLFVCLPLFHVYSFIATPDVILVFSSVLYILFFKKAIESNKLIWWILIGISMAFLMYSKYHGILLIFFTLISIPKVFLNPRFYIASFIGVFLFTPHLLWQYNHDFVSLKFHLMERVSSFNWSNIPEYLLSLLLVINPFVIPVIYRSFLKRKMDDFSRSMLFVFFGFIIFFLYQSFNVRIQAQWLILIYFPILILVLKEEVDEQRDKMIKWAFFLSLPLLLIGHIFMSFKVSKYDLNLFSHKEFTNQIQEDSNGKPVMFYNSYDMASLYSYYSDQEYTHSYNSARFRKNQFNIWLKDSIFFFDSVYLVGTYHPHEAVKQYGNSYAVWRTYFPADKIKVSIENLSYSKDSMSMEIIIENPYSYDIDYHKDYHLNIYYFEDNKNSSDPIPLMGTNFTVDSHSKYKFIRKIKSPADIYSKIGIATAHNSWPDGPIYYKYLIKQK